MVRSPSGVTRIMERAVGVAEVAGAMSYCTPGGAHVVAEDAAELVVADLADEGGLAAQAGDADGGVGGRAAGDLDRRAHGRVELLGPLGVDQGHGALGQTRSAR